MKSIAKLVALLIPYGTYSYFVMFGLLLAGGFGFPLPEDIVLITGGILSSLKVCKLGTTFLICMFGILIGDTIMFTIGARAGPRIQASRFYKRLLNPRNNERIHTSFQKYGNKVVFMARFMPGLRAPLFMSAGMYHVPYWKFFVLDGSAALISVPIWIYLGYFFGSNLDQLHRYARKFQIGIYGTLSFVILTVIVISCIKRYILNKEARISTAPDEMKSPCKQPRTETFAPPQEHSQESP